MRSFTLDATLRGKFDPSKAAEREFYKQLKRVAEASGHIVEMHTQPTTRLPSVFASSVNEYREMMAELEAYSKKLGPWAARQSAKLLEQVMKSNKRAYQNKSRAIGAALEAQMGDTQVGVVARALMAEQVALIKSIPIEAGQRAQKIAFEAALAGTRAAPNQDTVEELAKQLDLSTEVAVSRAQLIAITETARSNASINQARAVAVGSSSYRWHNSGDGAVRDSHLYYRGKRMQGQIFRWDEPPTLDDGTRGHPGTFPRCRCYAEPIFADE